VRGGGLRMEQDVIAMRVKELRQEIAELTRYYEEYVSLRSTSLQERSQENRIERLEEIKRELGNYVKSHNSDGSLTVVPSPDLTRPHRA
jgi:predicted AAA+ superfamily ATPase